MPTIDPTIGGVNANSYVDVDTADTYFDGRLNVTAWTNDVVGDDKARALIMATDRLDQEKWRGTPASSTQRLKWPRIGTSHEDGGPIASNEIPREIKNSTMELALEILRGGTTDIFAPTGTEGFKDLRAGSVAITFRDPYDKEQYLDPEASAPANQRWNLPPQVQRWVRHLILSDIPAITRLSTGISKLTRS